MNYICSALSRVNISKLIVPNIQRTRRIVLEETKDYSVVLFHWKQGQRLPMHDHAGKCVFKMLNGEIQETRIVNKRIQYNLLTATSNGCINKGELHTMMPIRDAISVHYYSPVPKCLCPTMEHIKLK